MPESRSGVGRAGPANGQREIALECAKEAPTGTKVSSPVEMLVLMTLSRFGSALMFVMTEMVSFGR
jgi:hypothetical protein